MSARRRFATAIILMATAGCNALLGLSDPVDPADGNDGGAGDASADAASDSMLGADASCAGLDLTQDRRNCGACGRDCQGGLCANSQCQPLQIASESGRISSIAVDPPKIYWTTDFLDGGGAVSSAFVDGGSVTTLVPMSKVPQRIALYGGDVYYATSGSDSAIYLLKGGIGTPNTIVMPQGSACNLSGLAVDTNNVYWPCQTAGSINAAPRLGAVTPVTLTTVSSPLGISVSQAGRLYWFGGGNISSLSVDGGTPGAVVPAIITSQPDLPTDSTNIYWVNESQLIETSPLGSSPMGSMLSQSSDANELTIDSTSIYWTDVANGGGIFHCSKTHPDAPMPIAIPAASLSFPGPIAVDSTAVYWGNQDGRLMKIALPP